MTKKVLVIGNCTAINYLISTVLKKHYSIKTARNSAEAMYQLREDVNRDLMIIDIPSLDSDNFQMLEYMSTSSVFKHVQTVVISDSDDTHLKNKTTELGTTLFLTKPFDPVHLVDKVRQLFELNTSSIKKKRFLFNMNLF